jgi:capsular polysaccharide transport system permease protein
MLKQRSPWQVTWSVWQALFIREAVGRLYHRRAAWVWLLFEPMVHIGFLMFIFSLLSVRVIGGIDSAIWIMVGMLGFFTFRRTMSISMGAVAMAKPLFTYRQVKPVDAVLVRAVMEGLLMLFISILILLLSALFDYKVWPDQPLLVLESYFLLWLLGLGIGMMLSVPRELIKETEDIVSMIMTPVYFLSGILVSVSVIPLPYRNLVIVNPVSHVIDALRSGFARDYQVFEELSLIYPLMVGFTTLFLGLAMHRVFNHRLTQQ